MSKHVIPAKGNDLERVVWILPDDANPGCRLRIEKEGGELARFFIEKVFPEKADNPNVNHIIDTYANTPLCDEEVDWLYEVFGELIALRKKWTEP